MRFAILAAPVALANVASAIIGLYPSDLARPTEIFDKACDHLYPGYFGSLEKISSSGCLNDGREHAGQLCAVMDCGPLPTSIGPRRGNNDATTQEVYDHLKRHHWTLNY